MLRDARGAEINVGDLIGVVTGGQNAMVVTGNAVALHDVKVTVKVISAKFVGEPLGAWARKLPQIGQHKQFNSYRVFRLGPCPCERRDEALERAWNE